jgi:hypothetical protein
MSFIFDESGADVAGLSIQSKLSAIQQLIRINKNKRFIDLSSLIEFLLFVFSLSEQNLLKQEKIKQLERVKSSLVLLYRVSKQFIHYSI